MFHFRNYWLPGSLQVSCCIWVPKISLYLGILPRTNSTMVYRRAFSVVFHHAAHHQSTLSRQSRLLIRKQRYQLLTKRRLIMQLVQLMISSLVKSQIAQSEYPLIFRHYFSSMRLIIVICANLIHCLFIFIKLSKFNCG